MSSSGSTLARRALGREMRRMREVSEISQAAAARVAEVSPQTIGRMEEGRATQVSGLHLNALCNAYGATDAERGTVLGLHQEVKQAKELGGGWWKGFADATPEGFDHYLGLEQDARRIITWQTTLVPGLLQTPEYRRAMFWVDDPTRSTDDVERLIEMASYRQNRLREPGFTIDVLLSEAVLRAQVGGRPVMADQLRHLADCAALPNVSIGVVPFDASSHLGSFVGSFVLLEFPPLPESKLIELPVVYVEGYVGDLYLERDHEVRQYRDALTEIRRVALDKTDTRRLIVAVAKEYGA
ncbi:helix-turn-helix transcriptional regulator [Nocardia sp. NPDC051030]|uniref:helix-turn-helix domain-containing protein n=1 Tax=Nocardia sp. NPDC051030 TaxID=3155162 RepID=UPI003426D46F